MINELEYFDLTQATEDQICDKIIEGMLDMTLVTLTIRWRVLLLLLQLINGN